MSILYLRGGSPCVQIPLPMRSDNVNKDTDLSVIIVYPHLSSGSAISFRRIFSSIGSHGSRRGKTFAPAALLTTPRKPPCTRVHARFFPLYHRRRSTIIIQPPVSDRAAESRANPLSKIGKAAARWRSWRAIKKSSAWSSGTDNWLVEIKRGACVRGAQCRGGGRWRSTIRRRKRADRVCRKTLYACCGP